MEEIDKILYKMGYYDADPQKQAVLIARRFLFNRQKAVPHSGRAARHNRRFESDNALLEFVVGRLLDVDVGKVRKFVALEVAVKHIGVALRYLAKRGKFARANERNTVNRSRVAAYNDVVSAALVASLDLCKFLEGQLVQNKHCVAVDGSGL